MAAPQSIRRAAVLAAVTWAAFAGPSAADMTHVQRALEVLQTGDAAQAGDLASAALAAGGLTPEQAAVGYNVRGMAALRLGALAGALADFEVAVGLAPGLAPAWANRGLALAKLERYDAAIADFDRALALQPGVADFLFLRGNARFDAADYAGAVADYGAATEANPTHWRAFLNRCEALGKLDRRGEAREDCARARGLAPDPAPVDDVAARLWDGRGGAR